uniref:Centromere protein X n=1 Tax=Echeneis naucrates TaxID=173247 RepID=A0A665VN11_ECHNA
MAEQGAEICFKKDTVSKLLSSFFKEEKTRGELNKHCPDLASNHWKSGDSEGLTVLSHLIVSGDAVLLMAEMLKIFVEEAAARSQKQAKSEDYDQVEIEHFEKILPQLLLDF